MLRHKILLFVHDVHSNILTNHPVGDIAVGHVGEPATDDVDEVTCVGGGSEASDEVEVKGEMAADAAALVAIV